MSHLFASPSTMELPARCITSTAVRKGQLEWTIQLFGFKCKSKLTNEHLESSKFHAPGDCETEWQLEIYPNGGDKKGSIGLYIYPSEAVKTEIVAKVTMSLLNADTRQQLWSSVGTNTFKLGEG